MLNIYPCMDPAALDGAILPNVAEHIAAVNKYGSQKIERNGARLEFHALTDCEDVETIALQLVHFWQDGTLFSCANYAVDAKTGRLEFLYTDH